MDNLWWTEEDESEFDFPNLERGGSDSAVEGRKSNFFLFLWIFFYVIAALNANGSSETLFFSVIWAIAGTVSLLLHHMVNVGLVGFYE